MKIILTQHTIIKGDVKKKGAKLDLDKRTASRLIQLKKAKSLETATSSTNETAAKQ